MSVLESSATIRHLNVVIYAGQALYLSVPALLCLVLIKPTEHKPWCAATIAQVSMALLMQEKLLCCEGEEEVPNLPGLRRF